MSEFRRRELRLDSFNQIPLIPTSYECPVGRHASGCLFAFRLAPIIIVFRSAGKPTLLSHNTYSDQLQPPFLISPASIHFGEVLGAGAGIVLGFSKGVSHPLWPHTAVIDPFLQRKTAGSRPLSYE